MSLSNLKLILDSSSIEFLNAGLLVTSKLYNMLKAKINTYDISGSINISDIDVDIKHYLKYKLENFNIVTQTPTYIYFEDNDTKLSLIKLKVGNDSGITLENLLQAALSSVYPKTYSSDNIYPKKYNEAKYRISFDTPYNFSTDTINQAPLTDKDIEEITYPVSYKTRWKNYSTYYPKYYNYKYQVDADPNIKIVRFNDFDEQITKYNYNGLFNRTQVEEFYSGKFKYIGYDPDQLSTSGFGPLEGCLYHCYHLKKAIFKEGCEYINCGFDNNINLLYVEYPTTTIAIGKTFPFVNNNEYCYFILKCVNPPLLFDMVYKSSIGGYEFLYVNTIDAWNITKSNDSFTCKLKIYVPDNSYEAYSNWIMYTWAVNKNLDVTLNRLSTLPLEIRLLGTVTQEDINRI